MMRVRQYLAAAIPALLCGTSLYRHVVPLDIPAHIKIICSILLVVLAVSISVWLYPRVAWFIQDEDGTAKKRKLAYWSVATLVILFVLSKWNPLLPIALEISAPVPGSTVSLHSIYVDGKNLPLTAFTADYHAWQWADKKWTAFGGTAGVLSWQGLARDDLGLTFSSSAQTGKVQISINGHRALLDITREPGTAEKYIALPVYPPAVKPATQQLWQYVSDAVCAGMLALVLIAGSGELYAAVLGLTAASRQTSRIWLRYLAVFVAGGAGLVMTINYLIDPLQFYRLAPYAPHWSKEQRYQNPGLAKNLSYETVLLGASTIEQYVQSEVSEQLGSPTLKLAVRGGSLYEQRRTLELALATGKPKRVIWMLDFMAFCGPPERVAGSYWGLFPEYLYEDNPVTKAQYLFNYTTTAQSAAVIAHQLRLRADHTDSLDMLSAWYGEFPYGETYVRKDYQQLTQRITHNRFADIPQTRKLYDPANYTRAQIQATIEYNILPLLAKYPEVQFDLVYAPYPVYFYLLFEQQDTEVIKNWGFSKAFMLERTKDNGNVVIHDFQSQQEYVVAFDHYLDTLHFDQSVGRQLLTDIQNGTHILTGENVDPKNTVLYKMIHAYQGKI